jgi:hypothetical protein
MIYTMFRIGENDTGGAYQLMKDQLDAHVPPHWMPYVMVESADVAAAKAVSLGAQQIVPPMDIPNVGRFAVVQDPSGPTSAFSNGPASRNTKTFDVGAPAGGFEQQRSGKRPPSLHRVAGGTSKQVGMVQPHHQRQRSRKHD